jgi:hypothetical protein
VRCDAVPVPFDLDWWRRRFLTHWPPGSPGYQAYVTRITGGTWLRPEQAARGNVTLTVPGPAARPPGGVR